MGRAPCCTKVGLRRGPWSIKEDTLLTDFIQEHGEGQWRSLPQNAGLLRCGKSCRLRWMNYLRPGIKRGDISQDEEDLIVRLHGLLGNRWSLIAGRLPGRTDNEIKNYWNTHLLKKLKNAGINPKPHKDLPKSPAKFKKSTSAAVHGKKKKKQRLNAAVKGEVNEKVKGEEVKINENEPPRTKVYLPKPIRVSSGFRRTNSYDSLVSGASSSDGSVAAVAAEVVSFVPVAWTPLFGMEEGDYELGEEDDDFLGGGCILPVVNDGEESIYGDVDMWEKVYAEFFQLL